MIDERLTNARLCYVRSLADVEEMMRWLGERREFLAVDVETSGLNVGKDRIRLCQFGDASAGYALDWSLWKGPCKEVIEKYAGPMVAHNLLYDSKMLKNEGVVIPQKLAHDTLPMVFLKNAAGKMSLKQAAAYYVDKRAAVGQGMLKKLFQATGWTWGTVPVDHPTYWIYGVIDTCLTAMLAEKLYPEVSSRFSRAYETELAVIHCLRDAELAGMQTDPVYRERARAKLEAEVEDLRDWFRAAGLEKPGSDAQCVEYLQGIGFQWAIYTEEGNLSVDKNVLKQLKMAAPTEGHKAVCENLSAYRLKTRYLGSYLDVLDEVCVDDVVYPNTRPLAARTGRMSITAPALQTLPRGRVIRDAFVAREGSCFLQADFAGQEMRVLAALAQEKAMLEAYGRGEDLHNFVARSLYGDNFTKPQRTICKNAGFAKVYGAGVETFAATAEISIPEATQFLAQYAEMFPGVDEFMRKNSVEVVRTAGGKKSGFGYVTLQDGRILPVEADKSYVGTNYKIQGGCAVVTKEKIVELDRAGLGEYFRLPVHDELIYEVPLEYRREAREVIKDVMPDRHSFPGIVLEIDTDIIDRWGAHYEADGFPAYIETEPAQWLQEEAVR